MRKYLASRLRPQSSGKADYNLNVRGSKESSDGSIACDVHAYVDDSARLNDRERVLVGFNESHRFSPHWVFKMRPKRREQTWLVREGLGCKHQAEELPCSLLKKNGPTDLLKWLWEKLHMKILKEL
jgi:hypothetical protein